MNLIVIALGWMLVNLWLTLIMLELNDEFASGWDDLFWLFIASIVNPIILLFIWALIYKIKERRK